MQAWAGKGLQAFIFTEWWQSFLPGFLWITSQVTQKFFSPQLALDDTFPCYLEVYAALRNAIFLVDEAMAASEFKSQALQKLTAGTVPIKLGGLDQSCECFSPFPVGGVLFSAEPAFFKHFVGGEFLQPCEVVPLVGSLSGQLQVLFGWSNHATLGSEVGWRCPLTYYFSYMFFRKNSVTFANFYQKTPMFCQWFYMMFTFYHVLEIGNFNFQEFRHPVRLSGGIFHGCNLQHEWNQPEELSLGWCCEKPWACWMACDILWPQGKNLFRNGFEDHEFWELFQFLKTSGANGTVSWRPASFGPRCAILALWDLPSDIQFKMATGSTRHSSYSSRRVQDIGFFSAFVTVSWCCAFQTEVYQPWKSKDHSIQWFLQKDHFFR